MSSFCSAAVVPKVDFTLTVRLRSFGENRGREKIGVTLFIAAECFRHARMKPGAAVIHAPQFEWVE